MTIREQEDLLFNEYRKKHPEIDKFVIDGIISEEQYNNARYKIIYILKEVNGGENWDLREFVKTGGRAATWNNIARWTAGILELPKEINWDNLDKISENKRKDLLVKMGVVNLKKIPGGAVANKDEINAKIDCELIKKQIEIYRPDIIICGGTFDMLRSSCYKKKESESYFTSRGIEYFLLNNKIPVIDYIHPQARIKNNILYYTLIDATREILEHHNLLCR
ncbi:MAG: hypothetical protein CSA15_00910 [Candidatus Delongbacteria bacterium]|nr:MAG: hypothetical protein CSA15_00910 [Candidatus Delongbacteria bacterium]